MLSARLRRCEPPPSQLSIEALCPSTSAPTVLAAAVPSQLAQPFTQLCWRAPGRPVSSMKFVRSGGVRARSLHVESQGPVLHDLGTGRAERLRQGRAALGRRRFAPPRRAPVASMRLLLVASTGSSVTHTRSRPICRARCWTQRRPPAGSPRRWPLVPSGRACSMMYGSTVRVPPVALHGGHGDATARAQVVGALVSPRASRLCTGGATWRLPIEQAAC